VEPVRLPVARFSWRAATFARYWRTPIEKLGDNANAAICWLADSTLHPAAQEGRSGARVAAKTIIVRKVELAGSQRDLYETVRAAMDVMVREEVASKGFGRSQIVILDALLKLRQVCCDPRLVKAACRAAGQGARQARSADDHGAGTG
jgi:hypothetical protein